MRCLCCGGEFTERASPEELKGGWHRKCVRAFFGTEALPNLDVSEETLERLARKNADAGISVPGVRKKLSVRLTDGNPPRLTPAECPSEYVLKPQTEEYETLPEAEYLAMSMARRTGIRTVPFALMRMKDGSLAYIAKRIDRVRTEGRTRMLAMEDFCQLEGRLTEDKYKGSYERCAAVIKKYSSMVKFDLTELYLRLVFSFAIGNSDMHLKNFSLIERAEGSGEYALSGAYDLLPVNAVLPGDDEEFALTMCGKKRGIKRQDFLSFAERIGLNKNSAEKMIAKITDERETLLAMCGESCVSRRTKERLTEIVSSRIRSLVE